MLPLLVHRVLNLVDAGLGHCPEDGDRGDSADDSGHLAVSCAVSLGGDGSNTLESFGKNIKHHNTS